VVFDRSRGISLISNFKFEILNYIYGTLTKKETREVENQKAKIDKEDFFAKTISLSKMRKSKISTQSMFKLRLL